MALSSAQTQVHNRTKSLFMGFCIVLRWRYGGRNRRKPMKYVLASAVIAAALVTGGQASAQAVGIATSNPGSIFHNIGTAVANAANQAGINATIQPATSPNQYIPFVASGGIEFGAANLQEVNYALEGKEWFKARSIRTCASSATSCRWSRRSSCAPIATSARSRICAASRWSMATRRRTPSCRSSTRCMRRRA